MLILNQGMQNKLSNSWTMEYKADDYLAMADDGATCTTTASPLPICDISNGNATNTGSIVNSLLLRKTGAGFIDNNMSNGIGIGGRGLEQKIKELKAEKECGSTKKCPGSLGDQDIPLDFSVKRRLSSSGSFTDDSRGSSSSPANTVDYSEMSPPESNFNSHSISANGVSAVDMNGDGDLRTHPSNDENFLDDQRQICLSKLGCPPVSGMSPLVNGMAMFPGLPSSLLGNTSAINAFSQMVAAASPFADSRNKKNNRPFKAYPKEALQMPLGFFGLPSLTNAIQQGADPGLFAGMGSEELMNLYNQQLHMFRDKQQSISSGIPGGKMTPPDQISTTTSSPNHTIQHTNGHPHPPLPPPPPRQKLSPPQLKPSLNSPHNLVNSSPISHPTPRSGNISPPHIPPRHISPDHLLVNGISSINSSVQSFPPLSTSSINGTTLVSSTSSSFSHANSRKRPRSLPDEQKDEAYWERRRKNNDAAKRSRDARRAKEDEIALRAALLEQENLKLRVEVAALKTETARLRCMLYNG